MTNKYGTRYLPVPAVCEKLGRRRTWLYERLKSDPSFPKPVRLGGTRLAFDEAQIDAWARGAGAPATAVEVQS